MVKCVACGVFAHRSCGFSKTLEWNQKCPVNSKKTTTTTPQRGKHSTPNQEITVGKPGEDHSSGSEEQGGVALDHKRDISQEKYSNFSILSVLRLSGAKVDGDQKDGSSEPNPPKRSEAMTGGNSTEEEEEVPVDQKILETTPSGSILERHKSQTQEFNDEEEEASGDDVIKEATTPPVKIEKPIPPPSSMFRPRERLDSSGSINSGSPSKTSKANFPFLSAVNLLPSHYEDADDNASHEKQEPVMLQSTWTQDGPPAHFLVNPEDLGSSEEKNIPENNDPKGEDEESSSTPLDFAKHPFLSVSRVLQENVIATFHPVSVVGRYLAKDSAIHDTNEVFHCEQKEEMNSTDQEANRLDESHDTDGAENDELALHQTLSVDSEAPSEAEVEALLKEVPPKEASEKAASQRRLGLATIAGGFAGGVAGFAFMGPVGGVVGAKFGQTAGLLGVIMEGSVGIGVLASGIAAGKYTGQQLQDRIDKKRILEIGEGTKQRLLLVRPTIKTDPVWDEIYLEAREKFNNTHGGISFSILPSEEKLAKKERYERECDIVKAHEEELQTPDKVLLLVSRALNNPSSLPGYVYRYLVESFRERCEKRGKLRDLMPSIGMGAETNDETEESDHENDSDKEVELVEYRGRRQDAHSVIKHVTAAYLDVKPGFAASPSLTELSATAVESLVFGEIYDLVIEEIEAEYEERDNELLSKIAKFERLQSEEDEMVEFRYREYISEGALKSLHCLPEAHSAVDKLRYCVEFLERISDHFSSRSESSKSIGADSLLKMVCQHLLVAKVFAINAQVAFLEEFARDDQLLRGKEGYALVTLQAALHFLNLSKDFEKDIFGQHEDD